MPALEADVDSGRPAPSDRQIGTGFPNGLMARILAGLFAAGATLALLTVCLPHPRRASPLGLLLVVGGAYLVAGLLTWRASLVRKRTLVAALGCGSLMITAVAYFSGESPSPLIFFYLWIFLYSAYFFTDIEMVAEVAVVGIAFGALLILRPPPGGIPAWWLVGMGTLTVAATVIRVMRARAELLIAKLYGASRSDPLTNLSNRLAFRELLDLELARARRAGTPMTVVMGDLDRFKEVNDRSGHQVGDMALQRVARLLERGKRDIDGIARVGGEEFALILPGTDAHQAFVFAERVRCEIAEEFAGDAVTVTISFGIACYPEGAVTASSLVRAADSALYLAKGSGRNRTVLHTATIEDSPFPDAASRDIDAERFLAVILDLAEAVDVRFSGSARHSETVGRYAEMMARELDFSERHTSRIRLAGLLHDIGKVGVPDSILRKPGKLTDAEFETIRRHPELGAQILEHPSLADIRGWVGAHHERPDGRGYPLGLSGEEIALEARILAVADAYEAMTSDRSYHASMTHEQARAELERCAGSQFDPDVVNALLSVLARDVAHAESALARL
jgi:diguanylate cyclase (GGDEF)-like protein/putative nucleotidyltransferase with HDIG domain